MSRSNATSLFIAIDSLSMFVLMVFMVAMKILGEGKVNDVEKALMEIQDYTCRITNMPKLKKFRYYSPIEFKAKLWHFV
jgi:hypothetical protein